MARQKMSTKVKNLVAQISNTKEPHYTLLTSDKLSLIEGLNYYAANSDMTHSKKWAIDWAKKCMPEIVQGLKIQKDFSFNNRGFVLRMVMNGFVLEAETLERIKKDLKAISEIKEPKKDDTGIKPAVAVKKTQENKALEEFDYAVDEILEQKSPRKIALGTHKKHHEEVKYHARKMYDELESIPEAFAKETAKPLKKFLQETLKRLEEATKIVLQEKVKKVAPKKINPIKMVSKLLYMKEDAQLGLKSVRPETIIGAKNLIVYNGKYRQLMFFKASTDEGFMVSGTTLKNFDIEKSFFKRIRKPEEMVSVLKDKTLTAMKEYLNSIKTTASKCNGRFNDSCIILKVSG